MNQPIKKNNKGTHRRSWLYSIRFKMAVLFFVVAVVLILAVEYSVGSAISQSVFELMDQRLASDIRFIDILLGEGEWRIESDTLYKGDLRIGNGTEENALLDPFLEMQTYSGSFSYTFLRVPDEGLKWVGDQKTGYMQGHFLRVAGSTRNPVNGRSIIGTYMDKKVADILDEKAVYSGSANVDGGTVYCLYHTVTDAAGNVVGVICVGRSMNEIRKDSQEIARAIFFIIANGFLLLAAGICICIFRWLSKLDTVNVYLRQISSGTFPDKPLDLHTKDELNETAECINEMNASLRDKARISADLDLAGRIQRHLLPSVFPPFPRQDYFDIYATIRPAREIGGDLYDFFPLDEDRIVVVIGDVSGKGIPAALFMSVTKKLIKSYMINGATVAETFNALNHDLCDGNDDGLFVTAWLGLLDLSNGKLTYVNAGHNPPLIKHADGTFTRIVSRPGFVLAGLDETVYRQSETDMTPGDRLFLYTDGITEATDRDGRLYGEERLCAYLNDHRNDINRDLLEGITADVDHFVDSNEQFDDMTMLVLDYFKEKHFLKKTERVFPAELSALNDVHGFIREALAGTPCTAKALSRIELCTEEVFVNIASYAYPRREGTVRITLRTLTDGLSIRFEDSGIPFNPFDHPEPNTLLDANSRKIGGLGILMVKKLMTDVRYLRLNGSNVLKMTGRFE